MLNFTVGPVMSSDVVRKIGSKFLISELQSSQM